MKQNTTQQLNIPFKLSLKAGLFLYPSIQYLCLIILSRVAHPSLHWARGTPCTGHPEETDRDTE